MPHTLPPRPNLDQLKHQAKDVLKAHHSGDAAGCALLRNLPSLAEASTNADLLAAHVTLNDAQHALALDYGFRSWAALKRFVERAAPLAFTVEEVSSEAKPASSLRLQVTEVLGTSSQPSVCEQYIVRGEYDLSEPVVHHLRLSALGSCTGKPSRLIVGHGRFELTSETLDFQAGAPDVLDILMAGPGGEELGPRLRLHLTSMEANHMPKEFPQKETIGQTGRRPTGKCAISGKVVSAVTGDPVPKAYVSFMYLPSFDGLFIDAASDGSFEFKDVPAGEYTFKVTKTPGYQDQEYDPDNSHGFGRLTSFELKDNEQRKGILFKLKPAFSISGRVLDENGAPFSDSDRMAVLALREEPAGGGSGIEFQRVGEARVIGKDGTYTIDGLDGQSVLLVTHDYLGYIKENAYPPCYYPGTFSRDAAEKITFEKGPSVANVDLHLKRTGGLVLEGKVTDEATGAPIRRALVVVFRKDMFCDPVFHYTDSEGRFRLDCFGPGEFQVDVDATPAGFVRTQKGITLQPASPTRILNFTLRRGVTLAGRFVDEQGKDLAIIQLTSTGFATCQEPRADRTSYASSVFGRNKYSPETVGLMILYFHHPGEGDYSDAQMLFPTTSSFLIQGMIPGKTVFSFDPRVPGKKVVNVLYQGAQVLREGIQTKAGDRIDGVEIVLGDDPAKELR